jgi:hypothetical protein
VWPARKFLFEKLEICCYAVLGFGAAQVSQVQNSSQCDADGAFVRHRVIVDFLIGICVASEITELLSHGNPKGSALVDTQPDLDTLWAGLRA